MTDTETTAADPTAENELAQLRAMAGEQTQPGVDDAAADAQNQRAERVAYFAAKVAPFVNAFGSRLKIPLTADEARDLTEALADVGAEILPDGVGKPKSPWVNLLVVSGMIAIPRVIAGIVERQQRAQAGEGGGADQPEKAKPKTEKKTGDAMLDALKGFDEGNNKPH